MLSKTSVFVTICASVLIVGPVGGQMMYWADASANKIQRANLSGNGIEDLATGLQGPFAMDIDIGAGKIYWIDFDRLQRANLDGSDIESVLTGLGSLRGLALDTQGGKAYWIDRSNDKIQRANLDGTDIEDLYDMEHLFDPAAIVLDVTAGKMYWTESEEVSAKIRRANMEIPDGEIATSRFDIEDILFWPNTDRKPWGLTLDIPSQKMYWTDLRQGNIQRANLDGSSIETLITGLSNPRGITLDLVAGKMYWADSIDDTIQRANLDGSDIEDLVTSGLGSPFDVVRDDTPPAECSGLNDCSGNGFCVFTDVCKCNFGWDGTDCSIPNCDDVNNCSGAGICIGPNLCDCDDTYSQPACAPTIPAVSKWGLTAMTILILTAGSVALRRRRRLTF